MALPAVVVLQFLAPRNFKAELRKKLDGNTNRLLASGVAASEIDRAAIEPERFAQLAGDRLQNVYEMQRGRDVLENVDNRDELVTLALQLRDPLLQPGGLRVRGGIAFDR